MKMSEEMIQFPAMPTLPAEIVGMAEADAAAVQAHAALEAAEQRKAEADRVVSEGVAKRQVLLARAKAGEVVPGAEIAEVEREIREAEASAALLGEALPEFEAAVEQAEKRVHDLALQAFEDFQKSLRATRDAWASLAARAEAEAKRVGRLIQTDDPRVIIYRTEEDQRRNRGWRHQQAAPGSWDRYARWQARKHERDAPKRHAEEVAKLEAKIERYVKAAEEQDRIGLVESARSIRERADGLRHDLVALRLRDPARSSAPHSL